MPDQATQAKDPHHHTQKMQKRLQAIMYHLRERREKGGRPVTQSHVRDSGSGDGRAQEGAWRLREEKQAGLAALRHILLPSRAFCISQGCQRRSVIRPRRTPRLPRPA
jgi:hypothetical protein